MRGGDDLLGQPLGQEGKEGRIGRSWGCPAVRTAVARPLIDALKGGQYVFSYYPNPQWLGASRNLQCSPAQTATASLAH